MKRWFFGSVNTFLYELQSVSDTGLHKISVDVDLYVDLSFFSREVKSWSRGFWYYLSMYIFRREEIEVCIFWWNQCNQIFNISNPVKYQILTKNWRKICFLLYLIKTCLNFVSMLRAAGWLAGWLKLSINLSPLLTCCKYLQLRAGVDF